MLSEWRDVQRVGEFSVRGHIVSWFLLLCLGLSICSVVYEYSVRSTVGDVWFCGMEKVGGALSGDSRVCYSSTTTVNE